MISTSGHLIPKFPEVRFHRTRIFIAYQFKAIREQAGMNRKDFSDWLEIPYRTMQEWELGRRQAPDYVLRLIAYKVKMEKERGNL